MSRKTVLRQAELISQQKVVPGTGTLTGVTVSAPITGGGSGPVVPIGATQYDSTHVGFVPSPGVNNHSKILWDDGWFEEGVLDSPLLIEQLTHSDTAVSEAFWSATDTTAVTSNVSIGIELPNSVSVAGDLVFRTGGTGASGSGVKVAQIVGGTGFAEFFAQGLLWPITLGYHPAEPSVPFVGLGEGSGNETQFRVGGFTNYIDSFPAGTAPRGVDTLAFGISNTPNFVSLTGAGLFPDAATSGAIDLGVDDGGAVYGRLAWRNGYFDGTIEAKSPTGISILAQTSATDGSNAKPTAVFRANTGQGLDTQALLQLQASDSSELLSFSPGGSPLYAATGGNGLSILVGKTSGGAKIGGNFSIEVNDGSLNATGVYGISGNNGLHSWLTTPDGMAFFEMDFDNAGKLSGMAMVDSTAYSAGGTPGITGTLTTASLIGKTLTFKNGLITGFS